MTELYSLALNTLWPDVIERCASHPMEARPLSDGLTALHIAVLRDPPVDVVTALLVAHPAANMHQDIRGFIPLHFACCFSSDAVVRTLIEADVGAVHVRDEEGLSPLALLCDKHFDLIMQVPSSITSSDLLDMDDNAELLRVWKNGSLLVRAAYHGSVEEPLPNGRSFNIVHACAGLVEERSDGFFAFFLMAINFDNANVVKFDEEGNLALHVAAASPPPSSEVEQDVNVVDMLTNVYPRGAKVCNREQKLPLQLAIESGRGWRGGVGAILNAFPGATTVKDEDTRLFPFMLAAIGDQASLSSIYGIFRACPELERFAGAGVGDAGDAFEDGGRSSHASGKNNKRNALRRRTLDGSGTNQIKRSRRVIIEQSASFS